MPTVHKVFFQNNYIRIIHKDNTVEYIEPVINNINIHNTKDKNLVVIRSIELISTFHSTSSFGF